MSLAANKRIPLKPERRIFTRPPNPVSKQPVTPRYLQLKKLPADKPPQASVQVLNKRKPFKRDGLEVMKNEVKKTGDIKSPQKSDPLSSSKNEMNNMKTIHIQDVTTPDIHSKNGKPVDKKIDLQEKKSPQSYSHTYNPNQFSIKSQPVKQNTVETKKMAVEEIQKNLKKWRIQRDTKAKENLKHSYDIADVENEIKIESICTDVHKFISEEKIYVDVSTHVDDKKCVDASTNFHSDVQTISVQVDLNEDETQHPVKNQSTTTINNQIENSNTPSSTDVTVETIGETNKMVLGDNKKEEPDKHDQNLALNKEDNDNPTQKLMTPNKTSDKKIKKKNDVHNIQHSFVELDSLDDSKMQSGDLVPDVSLEDEHKKSIYALVDTYLNKNKSNPTQNMDHFMKYMLFNLESSTTGGTDPKEKNVPNETFYIDKESAVDVVDPESQRKMEVVQEINRRERSLIRKLKNKEKYSKKLSTQKIKSKCSTNSHIDRPTSNRTLNSLNSKSLNSISDESPDRSVHSKKEKFKQLTLISSKQNENMCIHINYHPHSGPLAKSKLTIHKESHIDIRPQLTKHTFTTATCMPQVYSSRPNISTHYLVHLNEGGCKEIEPDAEEVAQDKMIFPSTGILSYKKNRLDHIIRALIRHTKLNMRLCTKLTSTIAEELLALQEYLCKYYSNQPGGSLDFNSLSPSSRQIITLIILEIDNPNRPNLDVKTNHNLKLILQQVIENINSVRNEKNVSGPPPPVSNSVGRPSIQNNQSLVGAKNVNDPSKHMVKDKEPNVPCTPNLRSSKVVSYSHKKKKFRKSFGMDKNYLSKKIRQSLDKKISDENGKRLNSFIALWQNSLKAHSGFNIGSTKGITLQSSGETNEITPKSSLPEKNKQESEEVVYETDWVTPSSSSVDDRTQSSSVSNSNKTIEKSVQIIETTNHAEIQIRLQDKSTGNDKEHYRISVRTDEDSIIQGVRPQLPCTMLDENIRNRCLLSMKETHYNNITIDTEQTNQVNLQETPENDLLLALDLKPSLVNGSSYNSMYTKPDKVHTTKKVSKGKNSKYSTKNKINFPNTDRTHADNILLGFSSQNPSEIQVNAVNSMFKQNNCGDSKYLKALDRPNSKMNDLSCKLNDLKGVSLALEQTQFVGMAMESSQTKGTCDVDRINIGVNTDVSLLENLMKNFNPSDTEDSYACDLSMCFSTDNDLSEGEIGFFTFRSQSSRLCHGKQPTCKYPPNISEYSSGNLRSARMLELQQLTDIFLIN